MLSLDPNSEDYHTKLEEACGQYEGLWLDWVQAFKSSRDDIYLAMVRQNLPDMWIPLY